MNGMNWIFFQDIYFWTPEFVKVFHFWRQKNLILQILKTTILRSSTLKNSIVQNYNFQVFKFEGTNFRRLPFWKITIFWSLLVLQILRSLTFEGKSFWIFRCFKTTTFGTLHFLRLQLSNSTHFEDYTI